MNNEIELLDEPVTTALTVPERAAVALGSSKARLELVELVKKSAAIKEVKNAAGRDECHGAAMVLVKARTTIEKTGKAARDDATQFSKAVIAEEKALIAITATEEARLLALRNAWDEARAAEKAEAERIERARIESIQIRIADIRECAVLASQCRTAAAVWTLIEKLSADKLEGFEEFSEEAETVRDAAIGRMSVIHVAKLAEEVEAAREKAEREAEAARLAQEREELNLIASIWQNARRIEGLTSAYVRKAIAAFESGPGTFADDSRPAIASAVADARAEMQSKLDEAVEREAQAAELARQRAEQDERDRKAKAEAAAAQKALDDQRAQQEAELQAQRDAIAAEQEAARALIQSELMMVAKQREEMKAEQEAARQAEADRLAAIESARLAEEAAAVRAIAASVVSDPVFEQRDGGDELDAIPGPAADLDGPSDGEIIAIAVTAVAAAFLCTPNAALNRLAEIQEWIAVEVA